MPNRSHGALPGSFSRTALLLATAMFWTSAALPATSQSSPQPAPVQQAADADSFSTEQLDGLLAPVALYPDQLLAQLLIATTFPVQIVEASRWLEDLAHKGLQGDGLADALKPLSWDPSVKSLVPFPQVLSRLNNNLEWAQQLGYAFANQQRDVLDSVQRLRRQAQGQGHLQSTSQQVVRTAPPATPDALPIIVIEPAQPAVVYVPTYSPTVVYGAWPYPATPPVVVAPSPGYVAGTALLGGLAFGAGVAITSSLWGWSSPSWSHGDVNVNVNRWNNINVNRQRAVSNTWSPTWNRTGGRPPNLQRPPGGPVGAPVRNAGLPANAIGRGNVSVPGSLVNHPARPETPALNAANRPNLAPGSRPAPSQLQNRPKTAGGRLPNAAGGGRPNPQALQQRQAQFQQPRPGAFSGMNEGSRAVQFSQRGAQSNRSVGPRPQGGGLRPSPGASGGGVHGGFHGRR